ncbi:fatty-acid peroxygenase [Nocardioides albertanoniae]|uniref:Fatty-acid peroxygenase n=1 Tax=Nocardioides albertanoniae TaxID=1175486 RepID=A0A543A8L4_9ACTN|nr:cytochrome P450 [Nocardioides albertanoniae]TQL68944.1 fatty-acid peroxygenase [Nocardioides albertanoniae]
MRDLLPDLIRSGYEAIPGARARHSNHHSFAVRLLGRPAAVVRGEEASRHFYDRSAVRRRGAVPAALANLLFGRGAVHGLDGDEHLARKEMFLEILDDSSTDDLAEQVGRDLTTRSIAWAGREIAVFDELVSVYGRCVQSWVGIEHPSEKVSRDLAAIVDGFGGAGTAYPRAWLARRRCERWARRLIHGVRAGRISAASGSALEAVAFGSGADLGTRVAAVELINVLRPTVAVAWPATFAVRALWDHPAWASSLSDREHGEARKAFADEVRRTFPFVPALAATAVRDATVDGVDVRRGQRLILDVPGTNTDPRHWRAADRFDPARFLEAQPSAHQFVPQGGGHAETGHRCPGEPLTVKLMAETLRVFSCIGFTVTAESAYDSTRIPTTPSDGLRVTVPPVGQRQEREAT